MVLQNIQPKAVPGIGFLAIILIVAGFAIIPYAIRASLQGAPSGQPTLSSPYVKSAAKMHLTFTYYFYWYNYATGMGFSAPNCTSGTYYIRSMRLVYLIWIRTGMYSRI